MDQQDAKLKRLEQAITGYRGENDTLLKKIASLALANQSLQTQLQESADHKLVSELKTKAENLERLNARYSTQLEQNQAEINALKAFVRAPWYKRAFGAKKIKAL